MKNSHLFYFTKRENGKEETLKTFSTKEECLKFCQKRDLQLDRIDKMQRRSKFKTKKVFFNVWAGNKDFFPTDEKVINWYALYTKNDPWWGIQFSVKNSI